MSPEKTENVLCDQVTMFPGMITEIRKFQQKLANGGVSSSI